MIQEIATLIQPTQKISVIKLKDSDNRILECALAAKAHFLVTGDTQHILPLKKVNGIIILSPSEFLSVMLSNEKI